MSEWQSMNKNTEQKYWGNGTELYFGYNEFEMPGRHLDWDIKQLVVLFEPYLLNILL